MIERLYLTCNCSMAVDEDSIASKFLTEGQPDSSDPRQLGVPGQVLVSHFIKPGRRSTCCTREGRAGVSALHHFCGTLPTMTMATQPNVKFVQAPDYRETYANSVQIRVNVWDFFLVFGTMQQSSETQVELRNFQGIYLSPQQAKALMSLLQQNVTNYEAAFGEIKLDPRAPGGPVH